MQAHARKNKRQRFFSVNNVINNLTKREIDDFPREKCQLNDMSNTFFHIWLISKKQPCIGCSYGSSCDLLKTFLKEDSGESEQKAPIATKTNVQLAEELGISSRQVAKRRKEGLL
jgi:hypothetical protein